MKYTILALSDTHSKHLGLTDEINSLIELYPDAWLIHAGDATNVGRRTESIDFLEWFGSFKVKNKIFIPGNHDFSWDKYSEPDIYYFNHSGYLPELDQIAKDNGVTTLINNEIEIDGLKILGLSMIPNLESWAFHVQDQTIRQYVEAIELGTRYDIVVSHSPPYKFLDASTDKTGQYTSSHYGDVGFNHLIEKCQPRAFICGHVHSSHGHVKVRETDIYNVAILNEQYNIEYPITVIEINKE